MASTFLSPKFHDDDSPERHSHAWCECVHMYGGFELLRHRWHAKLRWSKNVQERWLSQAKRSFTGNESIPGCSWGIYFIYTFVIFGFVGGFLVCPTVTGAVTLRAVTRDCLFVGGTETRQERRGGTGQVLNNVIITSMPSWLTVVRRHMFPFLDRHCHYVIFVPLFIRTQWLRLVSRHVPLSDK